MAVNPQLTSIQTFANPYGSNKTLYIAANASTANLGGAKVSGTNAPVSAGGLSLGTGYFTIELWAYLTASTSGFYFMFEQPHGGPSIAVNSSGNIQLAQSWVSDILVSTVAFPTNTWTHVAWVNRPGMNSLYINGSLRVGFGSVANFQQDAIWDVAYVGGGANGMNITSWPGYICGLRFSNTYRYTSNFVSPTTPFKDDASTLLLVQGGANGSNAISDDNT